MKISDYRKFRRGFPHHVYIRAENGFIIFYSKEDCIFYFTLFSSLSRKYHIDVMAFEIMPNHGHSNERAWCVEDFRLFHDELESKFVREYNREHNRKGPLFISPFGYAPKTVAKIVKDNFCYIVNNTVAGKINEHVIESRWNLLAYAWSDHPFSEKLVIRESSWKMKKAIKCLKHFSRRHLPLDYQRQRQILEGLSDKESRQMVDLIVKEYNFLNYKALASYYDDSLHNALLVMEANAGSEHDMPPDYDDYSKYKTMMKICLKNGINLKTVNFELMSEDEILDMARMLKPSGANIEQLRKFLHVRNQEKDD